MTDWVSATGFFKADTRIRASVYNGGASVEFHTANGTISIAVSGDEATPIPAATLHDLLTRAALMLETETLIAVEAQRVPTPLNGEVAQAIVDGTAYIQQGGAALDSGSGGTGNDTCACPDQEHHAAWCWKQRLETGAARAADEAL